MASQQEHVSMALFCDFENVALGVRDANYDKFDIKRVLERLLLKGSIVVKKAYCDWERYKGFKATMHEANFELIEIPHVRQSGKNSADIRLVVDALDLCYTKSHVNTFVIISGDSDFSPLVSKLRENAKYVIGVGVKNSTSDLLIANCDEFIFYDDLVRESQRQAARRDNRDQPQPRRSPEEEQRRRAELDARRTKAVEMAAETYEALVTDRDEGGKIWASVLKEALKRRNPGFSEQYFGFRTFGNLLEEAQGRGLLEFGRDEKSGTFVFRGSGIPVARNEAPRADNRQDGRDARDSRSDARQDNRPDHRGDPHTEAANELAAQAGQDTAQDAGLNEEPTQAIASTHTEAPARRDGREGRDGRPNREGRPARGGRGRGGRSGERQNPQGVDLDAPRTEAQQAAARKAYGYDAPEPAAPAESSERVERTAMAPEAPTPSVEATPASPKPATKRASKASKAGDAKAPATSEASPAAAPAPAAAKGAPAAKKAPSRRRTPAAKKAAAS